MVLNKLFWLAFSVKIALCSCTPEKREEGFKKGKTHYQIKKIGQLPLVISETSGLAKAKSNQTFWTHNDSGNAPELFEINQKGEILQAISLPNLKNTDWEDLAQDNQGHIFIADVGNNAQNRQDLRFYKVDPYHPASVSTIKVRYADQKTFPSNLRNFDCEATVWHQQKLYMFSKNWNKTNRMVKLYSLPDSAGDYQVYPQDSVYSKSMVTAADISPDGRTLALLTYGKVLFFDVSKGINFKKPTYCLKIGRGQTEAILFVNNDDFIFTNERDRDLYLVKKKK